MNLKFGMLFLGVTARVFAQTQPVIGQIPASELPPAGTDTGLEGKYDPQNGIAQLIRDKSSESAASKIFEDEHVLVFMPLPEEEVVVPGHVLVVPKRLGARNLGEAVGGRNKKSKKEEGGRCAAINVQGTFLSKSAALRQSKCGPFCRTSRCVGSGSAIRLGN